jgi:hypothetical protein
MHRLYGLVRSRSGLDVAHLPMPPNLSINKDELYWFDESAVLERLSWQFSSCLVKTIDDSTILCHLQGSPVDSDYFILHARQLSTFTLLDLCLDDGGEGIEYLPDSSEWHEDTNPDLRLAAARCPYTSVSALELLWGDEEDVVWMAALENPNTPEHIRAMQHWA